MPSEYFGHDSGRYFPAGSSNLCPQPSAYGPTHATSHGMPIGNIKGIGQSMGPDLGPFPNSSGTQTGGRWGQNVRVQDEIEVQLGGRWGQVILSNDDSENQFGSGWALFSCDD